MRARSLRLFWWLLRPLSARFEWAWRLRCDGAHPIGRGRSQYCLRFADHTGLCLAKTDCRGGPTPAQFHPTRGRGASGGCG